MKRYLVLTLAIIVIVAVLAGCSMMPDYDPYLDESFHVSPLSSNSLTAHAGTGDRIEGYFTIGGGQDEVKFWIEDPCEATVYDPGLVYDRHDFQVICASDGDYTLYFDNSFSSTVGNDIYIRYRVWSS